MAKSPIRVLCVDDHRIVREGITLIIDRQPDMEVVASAATGEQAVALFNRHRPDVTLMDLQLRRMSGLEAIANIRQRHPNARIVVLTTYDGDEDIYRALDAGAATYLLKDTLSDELIQVVRQVHAGKRPISRDVQARLDERASSPPLTPREIEVLELVTKGMRNKEIAAAMNITEDTVAVHLRNTFAKLKVNERTTAVTVALRRGIIHLARGDEG
jgi:DNA-binding NarL/FixJ family response regulator